LAGAGLFWEKSTAGWLLVAGLLWEKSNAGWWLISQAMHKGKRKKQEKTICGKYWSRSVSNTRESASNRASFFFLWIHKQWSRKERGKTSAYCQKNTGWCHSSDSICSPKASEFRLFSLPCQNFETLPFKRKRVQCLSKEHRCRIPNGEESVPNTRSL
jgi:hypothetical protein